MLVNKYKHWHFLTVFFLISNVKGNRRWYDLLEEIRRRTVVVYASDDFRIIMTHDAVINEHHEKLFLIERNILEAGFVSSLWCLCLSKPMHLYLILCIYTGSRLISHSRLPNSLFSSLDHLTSLIFNQVHLKIWHSGKNLGKSTMAKLLFFLTYTDNLD